MKKLLFGLMLFLVYGCSSSETEEPYQIEFMNTSSLGLLYNHVPVKLYAMSSDERLDKVEFYFDDELIGVKISAPYEVEYVPIDVPPGEHGISIIAYFDNEPLEMYYGAVSLQLRLGDKYQGGVIFKLDDDGEHGLIASEEDCVNGGDKKFGFSGYGKLYGATSATDGLVNTEAIVKEANYSWVAAAACYNYEHGGYDDWYLPSKSELELLSDNFKIVGGFEFTDEYSRGYWSSTEIDETTAYLVRIEAMTGKYYKDRVYQVRAIRKF
ncbi:DUF1566 domain-containing protein [Carboxylicivirga sediminis]|uniref:DUF1566 domain-containing protein n=1 Tax=Carboxylicivirga sediminis TaxID=2006564 RepID=A0A941F4B7_9BACT|nr:DUF1566 domain-containing protein [Carboxylicivirga sediminis]MBR8535450.1 DUF1566 domain-containing protein [Carboxylicivirga sediminis]